MSSRSFQFEELYQFGGGLESRTLKGLLTLDGFQDRFHRQLDWPSLAF